MKEYIIGMSAEVIKRAKNGETIRITPKLQEIVRCRDCKHASAGEAVISGNWQHGNCHNPRYRGSLHVANVRADGFCSWGERE